MKHNPLQGSRNFKNFSDIGTIMRTNTLTSGRKMTEFKSNNDQLSQRNFKSALTTKSNNAALSSKRNSQTQTKTKPKRSIVKKASSSINQNEHVPDKADKRAPERNLNAQPKPSKGDTACIDMNEPLEGFGKMTPLYDHKRD